MTKEELEKEADESSKEVFCIAHTHEDELIYRNGYLAGAEPREKQIQALGERCLQLQKDKGNLTDRVNELEAQIEKMKCGQNCKHSYLYQEDRKCKFTYCDCINCKDKWELRR